ncbi:MAG: chemotaxis protein CheW [Spirochaetes bacterium]|nr:chemotaxis protein CheW [Spirochaetota bacterium]
MSLATLNQKNDLDDLFMVDDEEEDTQANKYLTFKTGKESYGIGIGDVIEIIELQKIIEVPDTPDYVKGVINLRGRIIPVMDVRLRFHLKERDYDDRTCIVVVNVKSNTIGFIVDTVEEVVEILQENIAPPPKFKNYGNLRNDYIQGIGKSEDQVKILLDVERIMFEEELEKLGKMATETSIETD